MGCLSSCYIMDLWLPFFLAASFGILQVESTSSITDTNCTFVDRRTIAVHVGWPAAISCDNLVAETRRSAMRSSGKWPPSDPNATCEVANPTINETLWTHDIDLSHGSAYHAPDFVTPDFETNSTKIYHVILKTSSLCFYDIIQFNVTEQVNENCEQNRERLRHHTIRGRKGEYRVLECRVPRGEEVDIHLSDIHNYTVTWYRNCTELQPDTSSMRYRIIGRKLTISSLDFDISGIYSCAVNYKQFTRVTAQFFLCVQPAITHTEPTLRCPKTAIAKVGGNVTMTCQVDVGFHVIHEIFTTVLWKQNNTSSTCSPFPLHRPTTGQGWGKRARCFQNASEAQEHNDRCYLVEPSKEEKMAKQNVLKVNLEIRDIQLSDFGEYVVSYDEFQNEAHGKIILSKESSGETAFYIYIIIALSVAVGIILISVFIFVLVRCRKKKQIFA